MNLAVGKCPWLLIDITVPSAVLGVAVDDVSWHFQFYGSLQISGFIEAKRNGVKTIKAFPLRPLKSEPEHQAMSYASTWLEFRIKNRVSPEFVGDKRARMILMSLE